MSGSANNRKNGTPVLKAENLGITFGGLHAVSGFDLEMYEGELVGLIGPNGAGKTTIFNLLTGVYQPTEGNFYLHGKSMLGKKPHQMVEEGIARTFQNIRLWKSQSVFDNVLIAMHCRTHTNFLAASFRLNRRDTSQTLREGVELQFVPPAHYTQGDLVEVEGQPLELAYTGSAVQPQTGAWLAGRPCKLCLSSGGGLNR